MSKEQPYRNLLVTDPIPTEGKGNNFVLIMEHEYSPKLEPGDLVQDDHTPNNVYILDREQDRLYGGDMDFTIWKAELYELQP